MALRKDAAQLAVDVAATVVMRAAIVVAVQANPAKALLALTMVVALLPSAQRKLAVVVPLVAVAVAVVVVLAVATTLATKLTLAMAVVMTSSPVTFAMMLVAT